MADSPCCPHRMEKRVRLLLQEPWLLSPPVRRQGEDQERGNRVLPLACMEENERRVMGRKDCCSLACVKKKSREREQRASLVCRMNRDRVRDGEEETCGCAGRGFGVECRGMGSGSSQEGGCYLARAKRRPREEGSGCIMSGVRWSGCRDCHTSLPYSSPRGRRRDRARRGGAAALPGSCEGEIGREEGSLAVCVCEGSGMGIVESGIRVV